MRGKEARKVLSELFQEVKHYKGGEYVLRKESNYKCCLSL